jgi:Raf kinase inhibitor-like YbhB/YbcL family protein
MEISSNTFADGGMIPERCAFAKHDPDTRVTFAGNLNPHLGWWDVPEGTKSFTVICHDYDVPSVGDDVNQPDREVPADLPRVDFYHWVVVDLPSDKRSIEEGEFSEGGVVAGGRQDQGGPHGTRLGLNDFTGWFAEDPDMAGRYFGYDGPAPPWNDSILHRYRFTVYALDIESVAVQGAFTGEHVREAIEGHILASAFLDGTYTQNPRLLE